MTSQALPLQSQCRPGSKHEIWPSNQSIINDKNCIIICSDKKSCSLLSYTMLYFQIIFYLVLQSSFCIIFFLLLIYLFLGVFFFFIPCCVGIGYFISSPTYSKISSSLLLQRRAYQFALPFLLHFYFV